MPAAGACADCGSVVGPTTLRCDACHRAWRWRERWYCECVDPTLDGLGECSRCYRVPRAVIVASLT